MPESSHPLDIGFIIKLLHDAIGRNVNRELETQQLTNSQMSVLLYLHSRGNDSVTIRDIQEFLNVSHPTAAGLVKRLNKKGFVELLTDPHDKRARIVRLAQFVQEELSVDPRPTQHMEERLLRGFSQQEREQLVQLLMRVYQNVK